MLPLLYFLSRRFQETDLVAFSIGFEADPRGFFGDIIQQADFNTLPVLPFCLPERTITLSPCLMRIL
jgi:hypothetical protein